jgi:molecular chaperone GrpE
MAEGYPAGDPPDAVAGDDGGVSATSSGAEAAVAAAEARARAAAGEAQKAIRDAQLRAAAEIDNIRKRAQRDVENAQRFALERFAGELLAVRDSLELAVASGAHADAASLAAGQQATLQLLQKAFEKFAIQQISPRGGPFDPSLHEAVLSQPSSTVPGGHVIEVLQSGYQLNGRLLRPARVIVAAGDAAAP